MRVLVVHNKYSSRVPSGENLAVEDEVRWLREAGVDVHTHEVTNDDIIEGSKLQRLGQAASALWSPTAQRTTARAIEQAEPDVVHVHNLFPLLSASAPWAALRHGVPVVWTVHNRRVVCAIGTNFRAGQPCYECRPGWRLPGIRHACYGESSVASALVIGATSIFRHQARRHVTPIATSESIQSWLISTAGFPEDRVRLKYNGIAPPLGPEAVPPAETRRTFLFAGYLIDYKGVAMLLDAWHQLGDLDAELRMVGDGPLANLVQAAAASDDRVVWIPQASRREMATHLADARAIVVPSRGEESFGRAAGEALAYGRPIITTGSGGLGDIVDESTGWLIDTTPAALATALAEAATSHEAVSRRGACGQRRYLDLFTPRVTTRALIAIYQELLDRPSETGRPPPGNDPGEASVIT